MRGFVSAESTVQPRRRWPDARTAAQAVAVFAVGTVRLRDLMGAAQVVDRADVSAHRMRMVAHWRRWAEAADRTPEEMRERSPYLSPNAEFGAVAHLRHQARGHLTSLRTAWGVRNADELERMNWIDVGARILAMRFPPRPAQSARASFSIGDPIHRCALDGATSVARVVAVTLETPDTAVAKVVQIILAPNRRAKEDRRSIRLRLQDDHWCVRLAGWVLPETPRPLPTPDP